MLHLLLIPTVLAVFGLADRGPVLELEVGPTGTVDRVVVDGVRGAYDGGITVPAPGWQGMVAEQAGGEALSTLQADGGRLHTGVAALPGAVAPACVADWTVTRDSRSLVRWQATVTAERDLEVAAVLFRLQIPTALAGKRLVHTTAVGSEQALLPVDTASPYTFFTGHGFQRLAWECTADAFLVLEIEWDGIQRVTVQDNREFDTDSYEVQVYADIEPALEAGTQTVFSLALEAVETTEIDAALAATRERSQRMNQVFQDNREPEIHAVELLTPRPETRTPLELAVALSATYSNPFDPDEVAVDAVVTRPSGLEERVPGFLFLDYERVLDGGSERLAPLDSAGWRLRYCPRESGPHQVVVTLTNQGRTLRSRPLRFTVEPGDGTGFVRVAEASPLYFEFDDGSLYFGIGENVCWPGPRGTYDYDRYWKRLSENGANYARLWIGPMDCFTLERTSRGPDDHAGLGRIDLAAAWRVDYVLEQARLHGIQVMFCLESFNALRASPMYPFWEHYPYNATNGGPLEKPEDFFTDAHARELFRRRLRYVLARWGAETAVLSWEFWNEVDIIETYISADVVVWHREMARYLRDLDPFDHLVTTSWAGYGDAAVDALPEIDYIQSHHYGAEDVALYIDTVSREKTETFAKPHYFGEYGTHWQADGTGADTDGIHLHNGLWAGLMSGGAATAMLWWWDNYVDPMDLYYHFAPVRAFVDDLPLNRRTFTPLTGVRVEYRGAAPPARREDAALKGTGASWDEAPFNRPQTLTIDADGALDRPGLLSRVLHGTRNHPDLHNPVTFTLTTLEDTVFAVIVDGVSGHGGAALRISVDGEVRLEREFPDTDDSTETMTAYDGEYSVPLAPGPHRIQVENPGSDWVFVSYRLADYRVRQDPPVQVYGMRDREPAAEHGSVAVFLWLKHERYTWHDHNRGVKPEPLPTLQVRIPDLPDGEWSVEWWDTISGEVVSTERLRTGPGGVLALPCPPFTNDIAAKVRARR